MYKHILIATDGSELAGKALATGVSLAKRLNSAVTVVTVTEPWTVVVSGEMSLGLPPQEYEKAVTDNAARILGAAAAVAKASGIECATVHVKEQHPAEGVVECARQKGCDLIVMASHGRRGLSKLLLGSETTRVLTQTTVPVLVCR